MAWPPLAPIRLCGTARGPSPVPAGGLPSACSRRSSSRGRTACGATSSSRSCTRLHWPHACDRDLLHACAATLPGTHDCTAFTLTETGHRWFQRIIETAEWCERGDELQFWITADAFLRHMTRTLVGTMLEVAQGRRTPEEFVTLLAGAHRRDAGHTAKPHGLALAAVRYPGV